MPRPLVIPVHATMNSRQKRQAHPVGKCGGCGHIVFSDEATWIGGRPYCPGCVNGSGTVKIPIKGQIDSEHPVYGTKLA